MTAAYVTLGGEAVTRAEVVLPAAGAWWADVDLELAPAVSGAVTLAAAGLELRGTVDAARSGTHGQQRRVRLVGGAGSWGSSLPAKHYHNDAGVRARLVIEDAARESGETVQIEAAVGARSLGVDYVRQAGPASRALEDALGDATWWLDAAGVTQVASERPTTDADPATYEVLEHDPRRRLVTIAVDDLTAVAVGSRLTERLDEAQTVRELTILVEPDSVRLVARCGDAAPRGLLAGLFRSAVERATDGKLFGKWRYRVVQLSADRLELQAVRRDAGLPDVLPISMWPGIAGSHSAPQLGAEVLVEFLEGSRALPIVTGFAGKDGAGHIPTEQTLSVSSTLRLGDASATSYVAKADAVLDRLQAIVTGFNAHTHPDPVSGNTGVPTALLLTPVASVAAAKARVS